MKENETSYLIALLVIVAAGLAISAYTTLGPSVLLDYTDDFIHLVHVYTVMQYGFGAAHLTPSAFSTTYLWVGIPAVFMAIFGGSLVTESILSILCFAGTICVVFLIAKTLKNELAGLASAATFILIPLAAGEGASAGNVMPVTFFASLAVLMLLLGIKRKKEWYYALSGFFGFAGALAGSVEVLLIFAFLIPAVLYLFLTNRSETQLRKSLLFLGGILLAVVLAGVLGYLLQSNPLQYFTYNLGNSAYPASQQPELSIVLRQLFPTNQTFLYNAPRFSLSIASFANSDGLPIVFGLFGYAMIAGAAYLFATKRRSVLLPVAWLAALLLALSFGKVNTSFTGYISFHLRFMTILTPPLSIIIGLALVEFAESPLLRKKIRDEQKLLLNSAIVLLVVVASAFVAIDALSLIMILHTVNYLLTYQQAQIGSYLNSVARNTPVYVVAGFSSNPGQGGLSADNGFGSRNVSDFLFSIDYYNAISVEAFSGFNVRVNYSASFKNCSELERAQGYIILVNSTAYSNGALYCRNLTNVFSTSANVSASELQSVTYWQKSGVYKSLRA